MRVEIYSRPSCPLCDEAAELVHDAAEAWRLELVEVSIVSDEALFHRYRYQVPVVVIDGVERLRLRFSAEELDAALRDAARGAHRE